MQFQVPKPPVDSGDKRSSVSQLSQWPVQLKLVPINAPYFQDADLLVAADCVPFAYPDFHQDFLKGKAVVVGCPNWMTSNFIRKVDQILDHSIKSVTVPYMRFLVASGWKATEDAIAASGKRFLQEK
jgi:hypothetical protein